MVGVRATLGVASLARWTINVMLDLTASDRAPLR
jgi:hypothetical protein